MKKIEAGKNAYYQNRWENNGFIITELTDRCFIVWKGKEVVKTTHTLEEAEAFTNPAAVVELSAAEVERELTPQEEAKMKEMRKSFLYFINADPETGAVEICPADGKRGITVHNEEEARFFTDNLLGCFRTE